MKEDIVFRENLRGNEFLFHSTWGLFSPRGVDEGSRLLIRYIQIEKDNDCLDIGCGYGPIGLVMAKLAPRGKTYLVDKDFVAVEYTKKNVRLNGLKNCNVLLSNGFSNIPDIKFDVIASNLPAKTGKELLYILLFDAKKRLKKNGEIWVVTISGLREFIKRNFIEIFGNYKKVKQGKTHTVSMAVRE